MVSCEIITAQSWTNQSAKVPSKVLFKELFDIHDWGVILGAELLTPLATLRPAYITTVATRCFLAITVVLPKCSVLLNALASNSVMFWRSEPTVSGKMDSFSVSTRNAQIRLVNCVVSIIILLRFAVAKLLWLIESVKDKKTN